MALDLVSLQVVAAIGSLLSGLIYLLPNIVSRDRGDWARWWGFGKLAMGLANCAVLLIGFLAPLLVERVSHILLIGGLLLCVHGIARFSRRPVPTPLVTLLAVFSTGVVGILIVQPDDVRWAMGFVGFSRGLCLAVIGWIALSVARHERLGTGWIMAALFILGGALFTIRALLLIASETMLSWSPTLQPVAAWMVAIAVVVLTLSHFSLLLMDAERSQRLLGDQACHDSLTGALNRFGLSRVTGGLRGEVAVLLIDIDRFKALNDGQGHAAGDALLRMLCNVAQRELRETDTLVRIGGDEFLCVLPGATRSLAQDVAQRLSDRFDRGVPVLVDGPDYPTLSIGIGHGSVENGFDRLTRDADEEMYAVKHLHHAARPATPYPGDPVPA